MRHPRLIQYRPRMDGSLEFSGILWFTSESGTMFKADIDLWKKKAKALPCPACGFWVLRDPTIRKPFNCPKCGVLLITAAPQSYVMGLIFAVPALVAILAAYLTEAQGVQFVLVALLVFFPALFIAFSEAATIFGRLEVIYTPARPGDVSGATDQPGNRLHSSGSAHDEGPPDR
jgi:predicted RNA-binding Zn-ribbon protein involved in translation (DUF1610 family)